MTARFHGLLLQSGRVIHSLPELERGVLLPSWLEEKETLLGV
jgi:hypothetical protein